MKKKKRNPNDLTGRNLKASKKRETSLKKKAALQQRQIQFLKDALLNLSYRCLHVCGIDWPDRFVAEWKGIK